MAKSKNIFTENDCQISIQSTFIQANAVNNTPLENPITPIHAFRQKLDFLNEGVIIGIVFFSR